ncbi:MAG TPA: hypothetical protein VNX65_03835 [Patescibacteria group bacterium]|jgi:hypothetical protein|nr:hypothetical protein [Patescibacteria group bacterium]
MAQEQLSFTSAPTPESGANPRLAGEQLPAPIRASEAQPTPAERRETAGPGADPGPVIAPQPLQPPHSTATDPAIISDGQATQSVADDNPLVAADQDLIESVWVKKAKMIVRETKGDPYLQETKVSQLQADYLKKRYGKDVKLASY